MESWVLLKTFFSPVEAHMTANFLKSGGIDCVIQNEISSQVYNFHTPSDGGIKLLVKEADMDNAIELMNNKDFENEIGEDFDVGDVSSDHNEQKDADSIIITPALDRSFGYWPFIVLGILVYMIYLTIVQ